MQIYISPTQTRERWWHPRSLGLPCAPSRDSPAHCSGVSIPRLPRPRRRPPDNRSSLPFPGLCASGINRIDGAPAVGQGFRALNPQAARRVSPLCCVRSGRGRVAVAGCGCRRGRPSLPPGSVGTGAPHSPARPGRRHAGDRRDKARRRTSARMPCCPPGSPLMRLQASPGSSLKSLSRGSCSAPRVSLRHHPKPVSACCPGGHLPESVFFQLPGWAVAQGAHAPSPVPDRLPALVRLALDGVWAEPLGCQSSQGLAELGREVPDAPEHVLGFINQQTPRAPRPPRQSMAGPEGKQCARDPSSTAPFLAPLS